VVLSLLVCCQLSGDKVDEQPAQAEKALGGRWITLDQGKQFEYSRGRVQLPERLCCLLWLKRADDGVRFNLLDTVRLKERQPNANHPHIIAALTVEYPNLRKQKVTVRVVDAETGRARKCSPSHLGALVGPCTDAALLQVARVEEESWQQKEIARMAKSGTELAPLAALKANDSGSASDRASGGGKPKPAAKRKRKRTRGDVSSRASEVESDSDKSAGDGESESSEVEHKTRARRARTPKAKAGKRGRPLQRTLGSPEAAAKRRRTQTEQPPERTEPTVKIETAETGTEHEEERDSASETAPTAAHSLSGRAKSATPAPTPALSAAAAPLTSLSEAVSAAVAPAFERFSRLAASFKQRLDRLETAQDSQAVAVVPHAQSALNPVSAFSPMLSLATFAPLSGAGYGAAASTPVAAALAEAQARHQVTQLQLSIEQAKTQLLQHQLAQNSVQTLSTLQQQVGALLPSPPVLDPSASPLLLPGAVSSLPRSSSSARRKKSR
jgi:hypothetical protein